MREAIWRAVAWLCSRPVVTDLIIGIAKMQPYLHIGDYMYRWWIIPFSDWFPLSIRVHHIMRPDADPYLHDHPWNWRTIILKGWYIEQDVFGVEHERASGSTKGAFAETFHRIDRVCEGGVWTLFIMGRKRNHWGFMTGQPARKIYYRDYTSINGRGELQEPVL